MRAGIILCHTPCRWDVSGFRRERFGVCGVRYTSAYSLDRESADFSFIINPTSFLQIAAANATTAVPGLVLGTNVQLSVTVAASPTYVSIPLSNLRFDTSSINGQSYAILLASSVSLKLHSCNYTGNIGPTPASGLAAASGSFFSTNSGSTWSAALPYRGLLVQALKTSCAPSSTSSVTASNTQTPTQTVSRTASQSFTASRSRSSTPSQAYTPTRTSTQLRSTSQSQTRSSSSTGSQTLTQSPTPTGTPSSSASSTGTPSQTMSQSSTASQSETGSQSASRSPSQTQTPSATGFPRQAVIDGTNRLTLPMSSSGTVTISQFQISRNSVHVPRARSSSADLESTTSRLRHCRLHFCRLLRVSHRPLQPSCGRSTRYHCSLFLRCTPTLLRLAHRY